MKAVFLPEQHNREIQAILRQEYIRQGFFYFVEGICYVLWRGMTDSITEQLREKLCADVFYLINKILLDNTFKYIVSKNPDKFIYLISNKTFGHDLYISPFYVSQILELHSLTPDDLTEAENLIIKKLYYYIGDIYVRNEEHFAPVLFKLFEFMNERLHYILFSYYKFELIDGTKPILLYAERENYVRA